jgi:TolB-like protein
LTFEDMGEQKLKNIAQPERVYRVVHPSGVTASTRPRLPLPDKPSIAVLPFQNMSGDPEQEYFAAGIVEEIITALSRFRNLFVIARNSSFTYKGRPVDVKQVGRELGVRYVLEGSVRKADNRVRITGQLLDATTGASLWADRFDGAIEDIFDLQDRVTGSVVGAITPKLRQAEVERAKRKPTESLDAYDYFLRAITILDRGTKEATSEALRLSHRAIQLDPDFAAAYAVTAACYALRRASGWMTDRLQETTEAARVARLGAELGTDDAWTLVWVGFTLAYVAHEVETGAELIDRALVLNPNLAAAWYCSAWARNWLGETDVALEHARRAMRLSPLDPMLPSMQVATAFAHFLAGRYDEASSWADKAIRSRPNLMPAVRTAAASCALAGRLNEAKKLMESIRRADPTLRVSNLKDQTPLCRPEHITRYEEGLRKAGLPE